MKKYFVYLVTALLCGCSDFLEVVPTDRFTDETFWKTEEHAVAGVSAAYNALYPVFGGSLTTVFDCMTPNLYSYDNQHGSGNIARGIHDAANTAIINNRWGAAYQGIGRANTAIARVPEVNMNQALKTRFLGEAHFLRALYYHSLWSTYGGVPLILDPPALEQGDLPRNTAEEIEAQMLQDLDIAIAQLPATYGAADKGRAPKSAAMALKARILLYAGKWSEAAETSKAIIDLNAHTLFPNFRNTFLLENENNQEVIFDIQYKQPEYTHGNDINFDQFNTFAPTQDLVQDFYMTDGKPVSESPLYDPEQPYANRDPRLLGTVMYVGSQFKGRPTVATTYPQTGYGLKKGTTYLDLEAPPAGKIDNVSDLNIILFRYADVLLMYAEARNEAAGPDETVYTAINQVRSRAGMPDVPAGLSQEEMRREIRHERRIELAGEGLYYFDLKRWGTAETEMNKDVFNWLDQPVEQRSFNPQRDYLWPVPTNVLQTNSSLDQNPNYNR